MSDTDVEPNMATESNYPTRQVAVAPGVELACIDCGQGPAIVFIPHWTFTKEVFWRQIEALSPDHRVIAYDPRSQGKSTFSLEGNDYITHAHDLAALLAALDVVDPVIVGWGAGAHTAWGLVTLKGPEAMAALIVIDAPPKSLSTHRSDWTEGTLDELAAIHTLFLRDAKGHANFMRRYLETVMVQRRMEPEEVEWLLSQSLSTNPLVAAQLYASYMFSDHTNAAVAVARARPMLFFVAQGWADVAGPFIETMLPESRYVVFGGRMMFWEHHAAFNHVLGEYLRTRVQAVAA